MGERVESLDLGVEWEPNAPDAIMLAGDWTPTVVAVEAHDADADTKCVVLLWRRPLAAQFAPPNDEAITGHRLWEKGLDDVMWAGEVHESEWLADVESRNRAHSGHSPARYKEVRHFVFPLKEHVIEVLASDRPEVHRIAGTTATAALAALAL